MQYSNVHHCKFSDGFQAHVWESEEIIKGKGHPSLLSTGNDRLNLSIKFIEGSSHAPSHCVNRIVSIIAGAID